MTPLDSYIFHQSDEIRDILDFLNDCITQSDSRIQATIKWKVPFYTKKKSMVYLNVVKGGKGVEINFLRAFQFDKSIKQHLNFRGRKQVGGIIYSSLEAVDAELLQKILYVAIEVDEK